MADPEPLATASSVVSLFRVKLSFSGTVPVLKALALYYGLGRVLSIVGIRHR